MVHNGRELCTDAIGRRTSGRAAGDRLMLDMNRVSF
jgi:hypothetical protein